MKQIMLGLALLGAAASTGLAQTNPSTPNNAPAGSTMGTTRNGAANPMGTGSTTGSTMGTTTRDSTGAAGDQSGANSNATPAVQTDRTRQNANAPVPGANSFTEGQARARMEDAGYKDVQNLHKDDQGIWRGRGMRNGQQTDVSLDYQGNVAGR